MIRSILEERTARLRSIGLCGAFTIDPTTWRRMLKSTVAGTVAWEAAALIHSPRPVLASLGALLADISAGLAESPDRGIVQRWLNRAREIADKVQAADATVSRGEESLRFNHRARAEFERLQRIGEAQLAFEHAVTQTRGMVRSMLDMDTELRDPGLAPVLAGLANLLRELHVQVTAFGRLQERPEMRDERDKSVAARRCALAARDRVAVALRALPTSDRTTRLLTSILVDAERLIREVDVRDGAHVGGVVPA
jgi:hypothetical protein